MKANVCFAVALAATDYGLIVASESETTLALLLLLNGLAFTGLGLYSLNRED